VVGYGWYRWLTHCRVMNLVLKPIGRVDRDRGRQNTGIACVMHAELVAPSDRQIGIEIFGT
jgi:hypothetical protein